MAPSQRKTDGRAGRTVRVLRALAAVLAGNALYFLLLMSVLPPWAQHRPFTLDAGLLVDFLVCAAMYLALGALGPRRGQSA